MVVAHWPQYLEGAKSLFLVSAAKPKHIASCDDVYKITEPFWQPAAGMNNLREVRRFGGLLTDA
jgi:hypothetical protein